MVLFSWVYMYGCFKSFSNDLFTSPWCATMVCEHHQFSLLHDIHRWAVVRPEFTGTLAVKSGRHPILESLQSVATLVPNDVYCDDSSSFQIVQGPPSAHYPIVGSVLIPRPACLVTYRSRISFANHDNLNRKKHLLAPGWALDSYGYVWMLRACRICKLQVRSLTHSTSNALTHSQNTWLAFVTVVEQRWSRKEFEYFCEWNGDVGHDSRWELSYWGLRTFLICFPFSCLRSCYPEIPCLSRWTWTGNVSSGGCGNFSCNRGRFNHSQSQYCCQNFVALKRLQTYYDSPSFFLLRILWFFSQPYVPFQQICSDISMNLPKHFHDNRQLSST